MKPFCGHITWYIAAVPQSTLWNLLFYFWADFVVVTSWLITSVSPWRLLGTWYYDVLENQITASLEFLFSDRISLLRLSSLHLWWITSASLCSLCMLVTTKYHGGYWVHLFPSLSVPSDFCGWLNITTYLKCPFLVLTVHLFFRLKKIFIIDLNKLFSLLR